MLKRVVTVAIVGLHVLGLTSLALAGGGEGPPPAGFGASGHPRITGTVILDPHMRAGEKAPDGAGFKTWASDVTPSAKYAFVRLETKKGAVAVASFRITEGFLFRFGCDLSKSAIRFLYTDVEAGYLREWIPEPDLTNLFAALGEPVVEINHDPIITAITGQTCALDPGGNNDTFNNFTDGTSESTFGGWLIMDVVVDFQVPVKK